jgi:hypothetical protein
LKANLRRAYASALAAESLAEHALRLSKSLRIGDFIIWTYSTEIEPGNGDKCPIYLAFSPKDFFERFFISGLIGMTKKNDAV